MPGKKRKSKNKGGKEKEKEPETVESLRGEMFRRLANSKTFKVQEKLLVYNDMHLYAARVIKLREHPKQKGKMQYLIHYTQFASSYDEWVTSTRMLAYTTANTDLRKKLRFMASAKNKSSSSSSSSQASATDSKKRKEHPGSPDKGGKRRKKGSAADYTQYGVSDVTFVLKPAIQHVLLQGWQAITNDCKLIKLPQKPSARQILDKFRDYIKRKGRTGWAPKVAITEEICSGLVEYFNHACGESLLYHFERPQYNAIHLSHPSTKDCDIYGAHHLLRVLVMMPQLLSATNLNAVESSVFKQHILALMTWMERNRSDLFADVEFIETDKAYRDASV